MTPVQSQIIIEDCLNALHSLIVINIFRKILAIVKKRIIYVICFSNMKLYHNYDKILKYKVLTTLYSLF